MYNRKIRKKRNNVTNNVKNYNAEKIKCITEIKKLYDKNKTDLDKLTEIKK